MPDLFDKIRSTGYWEVTIRPDGFNSEKIDSLSNCRELLQNSIVSLRGWDYPHIEAHIITNGQDYIEHKTDYTDHPNFGYVEYMRLYQSAQYYHIFALREDYSNLSEKVLLLPMQSPSPSGRYMSILSTVYTLTEIFAFASKFYSQIDCTSIKIKIELHGMADRQLFFYDSSRDLRRDYRSAIPDIEYEKIILKEELIATFDKLALNSTAYIFERFNWNISSPMMFSEEQKKFLERRL